MRQRQLPFPGVNGRVVGFSSLFPSLSFFFALLSSLALFVFFGFLDFLFFSLSLSLNLIFHSLSIALNLSFSLCFSFFRSVLYTLPLLAPSSFLTIAPLPPPCTPTDIHQAQGVGCRRLFPLCRRWCCPDYHRVGCLRPFAPCATGGHSRPRHRARPPWPHGPLSRLVHLLPAADNHALSRAAARDVDRRPPRSARQRRRAAPRDGRCL